MRLVFGVLLVTERGRGDVEGDDAVCGLPVVYRLEEGVEEAEDRRHLLAGYRPNLRSAKLLIADLRGLALMDAEFTRADLTSANLTDADLTGARLLFATLRGAGLTRTNLTDGNISFADLTDADLTGTILTGTILTHANLMGAKNLTQAQLEAVRFDPDRRPTLPPGLVLPEPPPTPED